MSALADVLAAHQYGDTPYCTCGRTGQLNDSEMAAHQVEAVAAAIDVDKVAQNIWQTYVVEVGRALPEGMADKLAAAAVEEISRA